MPLLDLGLADIGYAPTAVGTNTSGVYIDIGTAQDLAMGNGKHIMFKARIATTVTGNANATLQLAVQGATDSAFTSPVTVQSFPQIAQANFATAATAGTEWDYYVQRGFPYRYYRLVVIIGTATLTAGAFDFYLANESGVSDVKSYNRNYTV